MVGLLFIILIILPCLVRAQDKQTPNALTNYFGTSTNYFGFSQKGLKEFFKVSPWGQFVALNTGFGYRDNITLSHYQVEGSSFINNSLELSIYRASFSGPQVTFYINGEDLHYLNGSLVEQEQTAFALFQIKQRFQSGLQPSLTAQYVYQDRVIDLSGDPVNVGSLHVVGHTFQTKPLIRWEKFDLLRKTNINHSPFTELELTISRQNYDSPLDDYWEIGPRIAAGYVYKTKNRQKQLSEIALSAEFTPRLYDNMLETDPDGIRIPDTHLEFYQYKFGINWRLFFDEQCRWRSQLRLGIIFNRDNGGGYYDYTRYTLSEQIRYRDKNWQLSLQLRYSLYEYDRQLADYINRTLRRTSSATFNLRIERAIAKGLKCYSEFEYERVNATLTAEAYDVNTISGGLIIEF